METGKAMTAGMSLQMIREIAKTMAWDIDSDPDVESQFSRTPQKVAAKFGIDLSGIDAPLSTGVQTRCGCATCGVSCGHTKS